MRAKDASAAKCNANVLGRVRCRRTGAWFPNDACPNAYPKPETCPAYGGTQSTHACWSGGHSMQPFSSPLSPYPLFSTAASTRRLSTVAIASSSLSALGPPSVGKWEQRSPEACEPVTLPLHNPSASYCWRGAGQRENALKVSWRSEVARWRNNMPNFFTQDICDVMPEVISGGGGGCFNSAATLLLRCAAISFAYACINERLDVWTWHVTTVAPGCGATWLGYEGRLLVACRRGRDRVLMRPWGKFHKWGLVTGFWDINELFV